MAEAKTMAETGTDVRLQVEVAYARPDEHRILELQVAEGTTLLEAARQSGMQDFYPEIDWNSAKLGIYGKVVAKAAEQAVKDGDRIEVYRPLIADPKEVRKKRAEKARLKKEATEAS